jgi:hypothetical protein
MGIQVSSGQRREGSHTERGGAKEREKYCSTMICELKRGTMFLVSSWFCHDVTFFSGDF